MFSNLLHYTKERGLIGKIDGILFDLGVSSFQLDQAERGFSFIKDGPLDMRMNPSMGIPASTWLMKMKVDEISKILKCFGEERFSRRIAHAIIKHNCLKPITRTKELANLIISVNPHRDQKKHPATRSFQAIRIHTNNELEEIKRALCATLKILAPEGRLSIITFQSLENRLVKHFMRYHSCSAQVPVKIPLTEKQLHRMDIHIFKVLDKIFPSKIEIIKNIRARSAMLHIAKKISL